MRVYVKTTDGINPVDLSRSGAAWTNDYEGFVEWMRENCPSSILTLARSKEDHTPWKYYFRFTFPVDMEQSKFKEAWGNHREKIL